MSLALPKPTRADRHKAAIDTSEMPFAKAHPLRDGDYRAWISRTHRCLLPDFDKRKCGRIGDRMPVEAAHLEHGGKAIKGSDASCVPPCPIHHDMLDAETLPWQIVAFLWMKALFLRERWWTREAKR
jgi:hypothetical protein